MRPYFIFHFHPLCFPYFFTSSHKRHCFRKKVIGYKTCVSIFSTNLCKIFFILRSVQPYIVINVNRSSCKVTDNFLDYNETHFVLKFSKNTQI